MGKQAPAPPNYKGAAEAQGASSATNTAAQTNANRPNQSTPFGSSSWVQGPDGKWTQSSSLAGPLGGAATNLNEQAAGNLGAPMDWNQFGKLDDGSAAREQAIESSYNASTRRLDPQWQQRETQMRSQLANSGLDPNSEAYRNASRELNTNRNDAYSSAMSEAIRGGTAAQSATFQQNLQARQQQIMEVLKQRGMPVEELQGLMGFMKMPGFMGAGSADPTQFLAAAGMQGNAALQKWIAENQANADAWGGAMDAVGSVAGPAAFALSDERAKTNIVRLDSEAMPGVPFATWDYLPEYGGARGFGVIAQDLLRVRPDLVMTGPDGMLRVNYSFVAEVDRG